MNTRNTNHAVDLGMPDNQRGIDTSPLTPLPGRGGEGNQKRRESESVKWR
jgi:hypothetical protein